MLDKSRLVALRKSRDLKPAEIAKAVGVSERAYYSYENGERDPSTLVAAKLAVLFGVSVDYIVGLDVKINDLSETESLLIKKYRNLSPFQQGQLYERAITIAEQAADGVTHNDDKT